MAQETALDWFFDNLNNHEVQAQHFGLYQQAKEMEKEQMKGMYIEGCFAQMRYFDGKDFKNAEEYYKETYNK